MTKRMPVDKREPRVREMFAAISRRYDLLNHLLSLNVDHYWRWRTTRLAPAPLGGPILDLCAGTGDLALAYWKHSGGRAAILAADFCHEMLVIAQKKAQHARAPIRFVEADAQQLPFPDDTFALVSVAFGLRNVTDTRRGLQEMARVTRPGGTVAVLEFSMPSAGVLRRLYSAYFQYVLPLIGQTLARNRSGAYNYLPASVAEFPQGSALLALMGQAGFASTSCVRLTFGVATLYLGKKAASVPIESPTLRSESSAACPLGSRT